MIKFIILIFCFATFMYTTNSINKIVTPIKVNESIIDKDVKASLIYLNVPKSKIQLMTNAVSTAARSTEISPLLIVALISTESNFKQNALSSKGYKGLMQTPFATMKWEEVDVLIGAKILKEKLYYANNDLTLALSLYKGGNNPVARKQALATLKLYKQLQTYVSSAPSKV